MQTPPPLFMKVLFIISCKFFKICFAKSFIMNWDNSIKIKTMVSGVYTIISS